jgi:hypothetical protein
MTNMVEVMKDPESYRPAGTIPSIPERFRTFSYLSQLVLDAFHDAKMMALTEERHLFDIARSRLSGELDDVYAERIYSAYRAPPDQVLNNQIHVSSSHASKYHLDGTHGMYGYVKRHFGFRSKFAWLICHSSDDVDTASMLMRVVGPVPPVRRVVWMLLSRDG